MPRVVFDTVVFVRCLINPRGIWGRLVFEYAKAYRLVVSEPVLVEILEVIRRPEISDKFRSSAGLNVREVLAILADAEVVDAGAIVRVSRDPEDDKFLATALAAGADYLVSEDGDLLDIGRYQGVTIINAAAFLHILEAEAR